MDRAPPRHVVLERRELEQLKRTTWGEGFAAGAALALLLIAGAIAIAELIRFAI